ncbi:DUF2510 domain-containing protein [Homoserinibacter sp. YIM 151385]|uniref:DUF2510 domain-containing protein n=1 Tax=Homoserinibacter sp. YIM 151385 TaxID=2985506 RepID=UPI0022F0FDB9|nr:DUF2510 domain-containing protein [Homoserinibacter sp. YIM 151385]WBU37314.1 DUF2510 domain-containing protein [Homoserinibacter sp. YIM 151385]
MSDPQSIPAGWYPDPEVPGGTRWWNGIAWTEQRGVAAPAAPAAPVAPQQGYGTQQGYGQQQPYGQGAPAQQQPYGMVPGRSPFDAPAPAPAGTSSSTWSIWLIVLLPLLALIPLALQDWDALIQGAVAASDPYDPLFGETTAFTAADLLGWVLGFLIYGATVLLAWLDWRTLAARGIQSPFHWAFAFIPVSLVYVIGRCVVAKRRGAPGWAPMAVAIARMALEVVVQIVIFAIAFSVAFEQTMPGGIPS